MPPVPLVAPLMVVPAAPTPAPYHMGDGMNIIGDIPYGRYDELYVVGGIAPVAAAAEPVEAVAAGAVILPPPAGNTPLREAGATPCGGVATATGAVPVAPLDDAVMASAPVEDVAVAVAVAEAPDTSAALGAPIAPDLFCGKATMAVIDWPSADLKTC